MTIEFDNIERESCLASSQYPDCAPTPTGRCADGSECVDGFCADGTPCGCADGSECVNGLCADGTPCGGGEGGTKFCTELQVAPGAGFLEVGHTWQFTAVVKYSNGTYEDVTAKATWLSSQPDVATVDDAGLATGAGAGMADISASFCGKTGEGNVQVEAVCVTDPLDIMVVLDRSYSMHEVEKPGKQRVESARDAAIGLLSAVNLERDQVGVVSFAGEYIWGSPPVTIRDSRLDHELSNDKDSLTEAIASEYAIKEPYCLVPLGQWGPPKCTHMQGATGIGGGLDEAVQELASGRHQLNARRVIVLMTDGLNNINDPPPADVAAAAMADGIIIVIVALGVGTNDHSVLKTYGTEGLYFAVEDASQLSDVFSRIPYVICYGYGGYGYGSYGSYGNQPGNPGPGVAGSLDGLRWEMPTRVPILQEGCGATCVDPDDVVAVMGGTPGQTYSVEMRIRGKVELKRYTGGSNDGAYLQTGGSPENVHDNLFNEYSLIISDPATTYYLNRSHPEALEANGGGLFQLALPDYTFTAQIKAEATVTLRARSIDGQEVRRSLNAAFKVVAPDHMTVVSGIPPDPDAYDGQFLQMDVVSVSP